MGHRARNQSPQAASMGSRLRRLRKERRLTQAQLARQIGIQQSDLSRIEKGEYRVSLDNLFKILGALNVAVTDFFGDEGLGRRGVQQPLSREDMQVLHLLRELSPDGRREVYEYVEFKVRRQKTDQRAIAARRPEEASS